MSKQKSAHQKQPLPKQTQKQGSPADSETTAAESTAERRNEDPLSGEAGAHPMGTGIGAAVGGAAAGAAAGSVGGPVGTVLGTIVGGVAGAYAGKALAENIDPTAEDEYWRNEYRQRPYYSENYSYEDFAPAYRAGWEVYDPQTATTWQEREAIARQRWEGEGGAPTMTWEEARLASKDAYERVHRRAAPK
jgi:phage tail tape-measure protein